MTVQAQGYLPQQRVYWPWQPLTVALAPRSAEIRVVDAASGKPVADANQNALS